MKIVVQPEIAIELPEVEVLAVRDQISDKKIVAKINGLPRAVVLWGPDEYDSQDATFWTNETARARAIQVLSHFPVNFE